MYRHWMPSRGLTKAMAIGTDGERGESRESMSSAFLDNKMTKVRGYLI